MPRKLCISWLAAAGLLAAADARFGFADPATVSLFGGYARRPASGGALSSAWINPAFRANFYPTLQLGSHWFAYGAVQVHATPYFYEELSSNARKIEATLLQAYVGYRRAAEGRSLTLRAGQLTSAFGNFPLRYDDARNWLIDLPQGYGYYYVPVTVYGLPGAEVDVTLGRVDARLQLTMGSPSNPRGWRGTDRYANWTAGAGVTIRQGFRVGVSAMHGPYLDRAHRFFFRGEAAPRTLPATGYAVDAQWAHGKWSVNGEAMRFQYPYRAIPYFFQTFTYGEVKRNLHPRWYIAARAGSSWRTAGGVRRNGTYEAVLAYRPAPGHLIKAGYLLLQGPRGADQPDRVFGLQYVMSLNPPAVVAR